MDQSAWIPYLRRVSEFPEEEIDHISPGRLAAGKTTIIDGDPGYGKSTLALTWAAQLTTGRPLPDGEPRPPGNVIILSAEDGIGDTVRPRLAAAGADLDRCVIFETKDMLGNVGLPTLPNGCHHLAEQIRLWQARLVIIDPLMAFLDEEVKSNNDQSVRTAMTPLKTIGEQTGCAFLVLRHLNKMISGAPLHRGGGSMGIIGAARLGLLVAPDPEDESGQTMVLASTKANISAHPASLAFRLVEAPGRQVAAIEWLGVSRHTARSLTSAPQDPTERTKLADAKDWLLDLLKPGPVMTNEILKQARTLGFGERTVQQAKHDLGSIRAEKTVSGWRWRHDPLGVTAVKAARQELREKRLSHGNGAALPADDPADPFEEPDAWNA